MTKQEKIDAEYLNVLDNNIERYNAIKPWINKDNGWWSGNFATDISRDLLDEHTDTTRPKSLRGIENNNGWVKIETDDDLPKEDLDVHIVFMQGDVKFKTFGVWDKRLNSFWSGALKIESVTHYQPIIKPENPIY